MKPSSSELLSQYCCCTADALLWYRMQPQPRSPPPSHTCTVTLNATPWPCVLYINWGWQCPIFPVLDKTKNTAAPRAIHSRASTLAHNVAPLVHLPVLVMLYYSVSYKYMVRRCPLPPPTPHISSGKMCLNNKQGDHHPRRRGARQPRLDDNACWKPRGSRCGEARRLWVRWVGLVSLCHGASSVAGPLADHVPKGVLVKLFILIRCECLMKHAS